MTRRTLRGTGKNFKTNLKVQTSGFRRSRKVIIAGLGSLPFSTNVISSVQAVEVLEQAPEAELPF